MPDTTAFPPAGESTDPRFGSSQRKEQDRLLARIETLRRVQAAAPSEVPPNLTEQEVARRLIYDMVATLTRTEIALQTACEVIEDYTDEQRASNQLASEDLSVKRQREADERQHRAQVWGIFVVPASAISGLVAKVASNDRLTTAIVTALVTVIGILAAAWGTGFRLPE